MHTDFDLTTLNTLKIPARAARFVEITDFSQLPELIKSGIFKDEYLLLGHGANILFTRDFPGTVVKISVPGWKVDSETDTHVTITASAGQDWHELVMATVAQNWSGMENMALIPGTVGASAAGNIAAYGQNQESILDHLEAVDLTTGDAYSFSNSACNFAYRESIFKQKEYKKYLITSVTYRLSKIPQLSTSYTASRHSSLLPELEKIRLARINGDAGVSASSKGESQQYSVADVAQAVINLRTDKLPDWENIGTAGSFFKNPVVPKILADLIRKNIPDLQIYPAEKLSYVDPGQADQFYKLPAGMLLDELGWRGKREGNVGTWPKHALVVINYGGASGQEVFEFSEKMRHSVKEKFEIDLEYEVSII